jgi:sialic acid synthase
MKNPSEIGLSNNPGVFFIAEAGINHNGSIKNAKLLIDIAVRAGAQAVKFQKKNIQKILVRDGLQEIYQNKNSFGKTIEEHNNFLEFDKETFRELKLYADSQGIIFTASGWDEESIDFLYDLGIPFFKIASSDLTNLPLLEHTARKGLPIVISTGMSDLETIRNAYELVSIHNDKIVLMQCTSTYPTVPSDVNLKVIQTFQLEFPRCIIGYSGHEEGISISLGAVALGAKVIERHFTLDRKMKGFEHVASLEEGELTHLIREIRVMEIALGNGEKKIKNSEKKNFTKLTKSLVLVEKIKKGEKIKREHLTTKGPGIGISPSRMYYVIGRNINRDLEEDTILQEEYLG